MFIHNVYFALKPGAAAEPLLAGCRSLSVVPGIVHLWSGTPADTDRPVIDRQYGVGLCIVFVDRAAHDVYQTHAIHLAFIDRHRAGWAQVRIFDFEG